MKRTFTINQMDIELTSEDGVEYKAVSSLVAGRYVWCVTNLNNGMFRSGHADTEADVRIKINHALSTMKMLFHPGAKDSHESPLLG